MGRPSQGRVTTNGTCRLKLGSLLKRGIIKKGCNVEVPEYSWTSHGQQIRSVRLETLYTDSEAWVQVEYIRTDTTTGTREHVEQRIEMDRVPSNLGRGEVLYFMCPRTGNRARVLYMAHGSKHFLSRTAYTPRIYYATQLSSRYQLHNDKFWTLDRKLDALEGIRRPGTYNGKPTKRAQRMERTWQQWKHADRARWCLESRPRWIRKMMDKALDVLPK